jgi:nucleoside-diphosphate kinase
MVTNVLKERTLVVVKPDAVKRALTGKIIAKIEAVGLKLIACKMILATDEQILGHYPVNDAEWVKALGDKTLKTFAELGLSVKDRLGSDNPADLGKEVVKKLVKHWKEGPVLLMVWEGPHAVQIVRKLRGVTTPLLAEPGSLLGELSFDSQVVSTMQGRAMKTFAHASGSDEEAEREIIHWFGANTELFDYYDRTDHFAMLSSE